MWELTTELEQLPAWEFATHPGKLKAGGPPVSLVPLAGSKPQLEDQREVDKEGGHLYNCIKILHKGNFCLEPVLIRGMEDVIALVSNLSPSCLKHDFSYPPTVLFPD